MQFLEADVFKFKIPDPKSLPFGNVMELAIVDRNNPLAWAVLAHEFGHYLDNQAKITESATAEFTKKFIQQPLPEGFVATCEKLCKEMVADLTGYYLLGPCSILPLVNMSLLMGCLMESPIKFDGEHGAPTTRIRLIKAMCVEDEIDTSQIDFLLDALVEEEQEKQLRLNADEQKHRETIDSLLQSFFNDVRPVILTELQRRKFKQFTGTQYKRAQELAKNLANGLPIGACRAHPEEEAIKQLLAPDIKNMEAVRSKYYLLTENAVDVSEVITAGWIEHIDTLNKILDRAFSKSTATDAFDTIAADLEELDRLVLKSIDTI